MRIRVRLKRAEIGRKNTDSVDDLMLLSFRGLNLPSSITNLREDDGTVNGSWCRAGRAESMGSSRYTALV